MAIGFLKLLLAIKFNSNIMETNIIKFKQTITSLEIAELTGKQHNYLIRDIRNMEPAWEKVHGSKFGLIEYKDRLGRIKPCYQLTKTYMTWTIAGLHFLNSKLGYPNF